MKLYTVTTIAKEYHGYKDVAFSWFRSARGEPRPYGELIENYDPNDSYARWAEDAIDELFTEAEAIALKEYLDREHGHVDLTRINEAELPTPMNTMALGATPFGGLVDCYMCFREPNYDLPFQVEGHFDLRHCEPCRSQEIPVPSFPGFDWYTSSFSTVMENVCAWFPKEPAPEPNASREERAEHAVGVFLHQLREQLPVLLCGHPTEAKRRVAKNLIAVIDPPNGPKSPD